MPAGPSLYRRYRPRSFDDVVGQEHVVRTLRNAIERDKVHHAYLFVGSRGTGKTSMAKILAASLNCERGGPTVTPCGECDSCVTIAAATSLDVIEMDAASNNSVDDIRDLRERVSFAPVSGRHKVYILDEAHMLSTQAWNAFLKTLEEPPPSTIFVLATTEANKVLPTVIDRCHRFDFARPTVDQIATVLGRAAAGEGLTLPEEARALIARGATGSFRDALGTLEQLVTYSGSEIALDDVLAVLGAADAELLLGALDAVAGASARDALGIVARLTSSGRDVSRFFADLEAHARALLVCQALGGDEVIAELRVSPEQDARLLEQAARVSRADVIRMLDLLAAGQRAIKDGSDPRIQLELALVKATEPAGDHSTRALLARLERLEGALAGGGSAATEPRAVGAREEGAQASLPSSGPPSAAAEGVADTADSAPPSSGGAIRTADEPRSFAITPYGATAPPGAAESSAPPAAAPSEPHAVHSDTPPPAEHATSGPQAPPVPSPDASPVAAPSSFDASGVWGAALEGIGADEPHLAALVACARPLELDGDELVLAWPASQEFSKKRAEAPERKQPVTDAVRAVAGRPLRLVYVLRPDDQLATSEAPLSEDELVARFVHEFQAEELRPDDAGTDQSAPQQEGS